MTSLRAASPVVFRRAWFVPCSEIEQELVSLPNEHTSTGHSDEAQLDVLVSVVALAYCSGSTIVETLDSLAAQTHLRIELVLCDDGSPDDTVMRAENWLAQFGARFERIEIVRHAHNVGIVSNLDSGLARAYGEWIKPIACDDLLEPNAIEDFLSAAARSRSDWLFSQCTVFAQRDGRCQELGNFVAPPVAESLANGDVAALRLLMRQSNVLPAPGVFYSRHFLDACGGLDLRLRHLDDWPLWLRGLRTGRRPHWVPKALVRYRISGTAITNKVDEQATPPLLFPDEWRFVPLYLRQELSPLQYWDLRLHQWRKLLTLHALGNRRSALPVTAPLQALSPLAWGRAFERLIGRSTNARTG